LILAALVLPVILEPRVPVDRASAADLDNGDTAPMGDTSAAGEWVELASARSMTSKLYHNSGTDEYSVTSSMGPIHYQEDASDPGSPWLEIDTDIVASDLPTWDWEMAKAQWELRVRNDGTMAVFKGDYWIGFRAAGFAYLDIDTKDYTILQAVNTVTPVVTDNAIRWDNLVNGVNLVLYANPGGLKEEVEITQGARDWCVAHPPSDYGHTNSSTYLVMVYECDWSGAGLPELADGTVVNLDNWEGEDSLFFRDTVADKIITALPAGYAYPEGQPYSEEAVKVRSRLINEGGTNYLLLGMSALGLNALPEGTIIIDPTVSEEVGSSADDDYRKYRSGTGWQWYNDTNYSYLGLVDAYNARCGTGLRFTGINLPSSATVSSAVVTITSYATDSSTAVNTYIACQDEYNPAQTTSESDHSDRWDDRTSTVITYNNIPAWSYGVEYSTPDISGCVQDVVDNNSGTGSALLVLWNDFDARSSGGAHRAVRMYDSGSSSAAEIEIVYTSTAAPTVTTSAATLVTTTTARLNGNVTATGGENPTVTVYWGDNDGGEVPGNWDYSSAPTSPSQPQGVAAFYKDITGLDPGETYYFTAKATNSGGTDWGTTQNFTTPSAYQPRQGVASSPGSMIF